MPSKENKMKKGEMKRDRDYGAIYVKPKRKESSKRVSRTNWHERQIAGFELRSPKVVLVISMDAVTLWWRRGTYVATLGVELA